MVPDNAKNDVYAVSPEGGRSSGREKPAGIICNVFNNIFIFKKLLFFVLCFFAVSESSTLKFMDIHIDMYAMKFRSACAGPGGNDTP